MPAQLELLVLFQVIGEAVVSVSGIRSGPSLSS
jgi:hypothetical protein